MMAPHIKRFSRVLPTSALLMVMTGCGLGPKLDKVLPDQQLEYKKQREAAENLEIPPDLTSVSFDDALDIPTVDGSATYSEFTGKRDQRRQAATRGDVLPSVQGVELQRADDKRWLLIDAPPASVWPQLVTFWRQQGILLVEQDPAVGVMKTDWIENRAEIRKDFVTRMMRKVADGLYATSTRDQFRLRIDAGTRPGSTEVYLTHQGMEERLVRNTLGEDATSVWEPSGTDPDKEAAMLRRLMLFLGVSDHNAQRLLAQGGGAATATAPAAGARLTDEGRALVVAADYRGAWRQVGLALDRSSFAVIDRDRSQGVFYVRYDDPGVGRGDKPGIASRLAFWKSRNKDKDSVEQYQLRLEERNGETLVTIHDASGQRDTSATAGRILALLKDELR